MGGFSLFHWIIVLFVLAIPAAIIGAIWLIVRALRRPSAKTQPAIPASSSTAPVSTIESRLQELARLKSKGLITDLEYEQQRSVILKGV